MRFFTLLLCLCAVGTLAAPADAQRGKLGREKFSDSHYGFEIRILDRWEIVPTRDGSGGIFLDTVMKASGSTLTINIGNQAAQIDPTLEIVKFDHIEFVEEEEEEPEEEGGDEDSDSKEIAIPHDIDEYFEILNKFGFDTLSKKEKKYGRNKAMHQVFKFKHGRYDFDLIADTFTFDMGEYDICLIYTIPEQHYKKYSKAFTDSAKSYKLIERTERVVLRDRRDYDQFVAYHRDEVSRTPGWRLLETDSQRFVIKTSVDDKRWLEGIIDRLEKSRDLYERDFPPHKPIEAVSVVRVCSNAEEFHKYGRTGGGDGYGTLGWFNPMSEELVVYKAMRDPNQVYGVMSHEAFHQYCHFLFDMSEAHRWFDEGHGDYYGAFEFKGKKAIAKARMKGFSRLEHIRGELREETFVPISEHVRMDHGEWQSSYGYPQSWSLIYYLRQGMLGNVPKKLWLDEYADIIPEYMDHLFAGYKAAYDEIREERAEKAKKKGETTGVAAQEVNRFDLKKEQKEAIWKTAIEASWGKIEEFDPELEEFTQRWSEYVLKHVRD